jgi:hypothetical protein
MVIDEQALGELDAEQLREVSLDDIRQTESQSAHAFSRAAWSLFSPLAQRRNGRTGFARLCVRHRDGRA